MLYEETFGNTGGEAWGQYFKPVSCLWKVESSLPVNEETGDVGQEMKSCIVIGCG
jgi:hypothetical protein